MRLLSFVLAFLLATSAIAANAPPGLQKKGISTTPSFLGKTPPGWDQGLKRGWNKNRNWHWNKDTRFWENRNWRWENDGWVKVRRH